MSVNNGIITAPVSIDDVKSVLGESSNDLATLCKSANINPFSLHKPIKNRKLFGMNDGDYNGTDGDYGIRVESVGSFSALLFLYENDGNRGYSYSAPTGGLLSPYRLEDFNGYNHYATTNIRNLNVTLSFDSSGKILITGSCDFTLQDGDGVAIGNIFDNCYFGIVLCQQGNAKYYRTSNNAIGQAGTSVELNETVVTMQSGLYDVCPFISNEKYDSEVINGNFPLNTTKLYALPQVSIVSIKIPEKEEPITKLSIKTAKYWTTELGGALKGKFLYVHNGANHTTFSSIRIYAEYSGNKTLINPLGQDITLEPGKDSTYIDVATYVDNYLSVTFKVYGNATQDLATSFTPTINEWEE